MPTYEFYCEKCDKQVSVFISISEYEKKEYKCPDCSGKRLTRLISAFQTITSKKS